MHTASHEPDSERPARRGPLRGIGVALAGLLAVLALVRWVLGPMVVRSAVVDALPWSEPVVAVQAVGVGPGSIRVHGFGLLLPDDAGVFAADEVVLRFGLRELFATPRTVRLIQVRRPVLDVTRTVAGWPAPPAASAGGRGVVVERIDIVEGRATAFEGSGALYGAAEGVQGRARFESGVGPRVSLEPVTLTLRAPRWLPRPVAVGGALALAEGRWRIEALDLMDAAGGRISVDGVVDVAGAGPARAELTVRGDSLRLRALHPALHATADSTARVGLEASLRGTGAALEIRATLSPRRGGQVDFDGAWVEVPGGRRVDGTVSWSDVDASRLFGPRFPAGAMNGSLRLSLDLTGAASPAGGEARP